MAGGGLYPSGCPYCAGKQAWPGENDLASQRPDLLDQWHPTKNLPMTPERVTVGGHFKAWWVCEQGHEWQAIVKSRTLGGCGCPVCAGKLVVAGENNLESQFPAVAAQWHPTLNGALTPEQVTAGSHRTVWWMCPNGHIWKAIVYSRAGPQKCGCPVCAGKVRPERQERYRRALAEVEAKQAGQPIPGPKEKHNRRNEK